MSFLLGLTGSIGMGKSTTGKLFVEEGCALWDADAAVHRLYAAGGAAVEPMRSAFPDAVTEGAVDRAELKKTIVADGTALKRIEDIVHPLVARDRQDFIASASADIVVLDIPLLFETGGEKAMDAIACVTVPPEVQRARVLARGTMTEREMNHILSKQMPNTDKCEKSDYVIKTDTLDGARAQVRDIVAEIRERRQDA